MEYACENLNLELENKRLKNLLRNSEEKLAKEHFLLQKFDLLNQNTPLAVIGCDANFCITEWNKSAETIFGYSKEEAIGKLVPELIIPDSAKDTIDKIWELLLNNTGGTRSTNQNLRKDGEIILCEWYNMPNLNANGEVIGISCMALDISEKTKTSAALDESEVRYKMLSELTSEGIFIHKNEITLDVNASLEHLILFNRHEIIGKNFIEVFIPHNFRAIVRENLTIKQDKPYEIQIVRKDGELIWVEFEAKSTLFQGQEISTVAIRDIHHRKQNEEKLHKALFDAQESDRLKSTFLSTISHELRTPLNAVIGFSDLIDKNMSIEEASSLAEMINKSGNHLLEIINDIFDLSMLQEGTIVLNKNKHKLNDLMSEMQEFISLEKIKMNKKEIQINFLVDDSAKDIIINTDQKRFKQILGHLLKNALKYTKEGSVEAGYSHVTDAIRFYVKDTGIGIPEENQKIIFDQFRQIDDRNTRKYEGLGIGLTIAKNLCENLGGKMGLLSEAGQGSTFYFTIPYENELLESYENKPRLNIDLSILNHKTILIAEDDSSSFELLSMHLGRYKANVFWAKNGKEAIDIFNKNKQIDLILMDIKMPVLSGYEASREIKRLSPTLPIIAQTAYAINNEEEIAIQAGCDDYVSKPINWSILARKIAFQLQKAKN